MPIRLDASPVAPERHPDFHRRPFPVPTPATFEHQTQFATLRVFTIRDHRLIDWERDLDLYTERLGLGRVVWPVIYTVFTENFDELVEAIKARRLWLFDIWGHVPGSAPEGMWAHVVPPAGLVERLRQRLGDRFLGFDNGEQDGRYIGLYAGQQCPYPGDRFGAFLNFHRHFRRLGDDMGNQLSALISLQFAHHFAREGNHLLLGAETAQALPNSQVYYSFIRGAGKQHGLLWFGNASIYNRWSFRSYCGEGESYGLRFGPSAGTSLSLLRRLLYAHILYGCSIVGFENQWVMGDDNEKRLAGQSISINTDPSSAQLSPIGQIQAAAVRWTRRHGSIGTMLTPVGLLLDVFCGWCVPRHQYVSQVYQIWGCMPYNDGDHLTHGVMSMLYPGYEDAGYFRNEQGFFTATPYGDIADTLLSDAPAFVMERYNTILCAGRIEPDDELRDKLDDYVRCGGNLVMTQANAHWLLGPSAWGEPVHIPPGPVSFTDGAVIDEPRGFTIHPLVDSAGWAALASTAGQAVVVTRTHGAGRLTILLSEYGLEQPDPVVRASNEVERPLPPLKPLLAHARHALERVLRSNQLIAADPNLATIVCRAPGENQYTVGVFNNTLASCPLALKSNIGRIVQRTELPLEPIPAGCPGHLPLAGSISPQPQPSAEDTIAAGEVRIFRLRVQEESHVAVLSPPAPPPRPVNRFISLRGHPSATHTLLRWATFFQHLDGITLDWTYLRDRDRKAVAFEGEWLRRQSIRIFVDFTSGLNFYPDLTLLDTFPPRYRESLEMMEDVLAKAALVGAEGVIASLHRIPENHCTEARARERFIAGVRALARQVQAKLGDGARCYLTQHPTKQIASAAALFGFVDETGGVHPAWHLGHEVDSPNAWPHESSSRIALVLAAAGTVDSQGQWYDAHAPAHQLRHINWAELRAGNIPIVLDSSYPTWNDAWRDIRAVFEG